MSWHQAPVVAAAIASHIPPISLLVRLVVVASERVRVVWRAGARQEGCPPCSTSTSMVAASPTTRAGKVGRQEVSPEGRPTTARVQGSRQERRRVGSILGLEQEEEEDEEEVVEEEEEETSTGVDDDGWVPTVGGAGGEWEQAGWRCLTTPGLFEAKRQQVRQ